MILYNLHGYFPIKLNELANKISATNKVGKSIFLRITGALGLLNISVTREVITFLRVFCDDCW